MGNFILHWLDSALGCAGCHFYFFSASKWKRSKQRSILHWFCLFALKYLLPFFRNFSLFSHQIFHLVLLQITFYWTLIVEFDIYTYDLFNVCVCLSSICTVCREGMWIDLLHWWSPTPPPPPSPLPHILLFNVRVQRLFCDSLASYNLHQWFVKSWSPHGDWPMNSFYASLGQ